jgi:AhpD family alkylhydroperoxidase
LAKVPAPYERFQRRYRRVWKAYDSLGAAVHQEGPLDPKTRELIKLGIAIGGRLDGAVRAHVRLGLQQGASPEEIRQVALLAITTSGFPTAMAGVTAIEDGLSKRRGKRRGPRKRR